MTPQHSSGPICTLVSPARRRALAEAFVSTAAGFLLALLLVLPANAAPAPEADCASGKVPITRENGKLKCLHDTDGDGLANKVEKQDLGTNPLLADTDGDSLNDGFEVANGIDPLATDTDGDRLRDGFEVANGIDPLATDTDNDGLNDRVETRGCTDPLSADSDNDGTNDGEEVDAGTDPCETSA